MSKKDKPVRMTHREALEEIASRLSPKEDVVVRKNAEESEEEQPSPNIPPREVVKFRRDALHEERRKNRPFETETIRNTDMVRDRFELVKNVTPEDLSTPLLQVKQRDMTNVNHYINVYRTEKGEFLVCLYDWRNGTDAPAVRRIETNDGDMVCETITLYMTTIDFDLL